MTVSESFQWFTTVAGLFIAVAALDPDKRAWAKKKAMGLLAVMFYIAIIGTGIVGVLMFGMADGLPTRGQILLLVMQLFNFFMGMNLATEAILERRRKPSRDDLAQAWAGVLKPTEQQQGAAISNGKKLPD